MCLNRGSDRLGWRVGFPIAIGIVFFAYHLPAQGIQTQEVYRRLGETGEAGFEIRFDAGLDTQRSKNLGQSLCGGFKVVKDASHED
jgi:hypothetical protein